ncbi:MAG TPA: AarF/UbiB family protein [Spirochaetia bacterium]|nr:AarF/UbiB family protein [Spirochaetia bacterium]
MLRSRYRRVLRYFSGVMLRTVVWDVVFPRVGLRWLSVRTRPRRLRSVAASFRTLAVRHGGVLIKVGQFLSARLDVLPREVTAELADLQDEVGAERFEDIRRVAEAEFDASLGETFASFDPVPLASASIGQVHSARLRRSSEEEEPSPPVVVKVQRPRIQEIVEADLAAIRVAGGWLQRMESVRRHVHVPALIEEFSRSLYEEIDYEREGRNAEKFAANVGGNPGVRVPRVIWSHTTRRALTLEDVGAIKITSYAAIEAAGIDRRQVANRLMDVYLKQVFEDGFFHADPHPGNLFVLPDRRAPGGWRLVFVDFGMTGTLSSDTFAALREALISVATRDSPRLVQSFQKLHILLPGADLELVQRACERVFNVIWGKSTRDMMRMTREEAAAFAEEFGDLLYQMPFQVPEHLILLGRCVSILSGIASGLDPDFNVWNGLAPYARRLVADTSGGTTGRLLREIAEVARTLAGLPRRADTLMSRAEQGRLDVRLPELRQHVARLERGVRKLAGSIIFAAGLVAGTELYLAGRVEIAAAVGVVEVFLLGWVLFGR